MGGSGDPPNVSASLDSSRFDLLVVGAGYTGLTAARAAAQAGRSTFVLDRGPLGHGASGRNAGFVLPGYKADLLALLRRFGPTRSRELFHDSLRAIDFIEQLIQQEGIACHWHRPGSLVLAARPGHAQALAAEHRLLAEYGHPTTLLGPAGLRDEIGSDAYHGGLLDPVAGALHPMEYLLGLAHAARRAGAAIRTGIEVLGMVREQGSFRVETSGGTVIARQVLIATNGYTGPLVPWLARRVVPVGSFILATAPLHPALVDRLMPRRRVMNDTRNLLYYFRVSPDGRLLFGGRAAVRAESLAQSVTMLQRGLVSVFPELASVPIEFSWGGTLGFTRDSLPHVGLHDGVGYVLGCGGHGVAMCSWLGDQAGKALAGQGPWPRLAEIAFPAVPLYTGRPWFLPLAGAYFGFRDRVGL